MPVNLFSRSLRHLVDLLVLAVGWWLIILSVLTCIEMVTRKLFSFSLQGIDEVGGYTLAIASAVGFSYTLITRGHTRIDFLVGKLPLKARSVLNALAMVTLAAMVLFALWRGWTVVAESIEFQSRATTPLQTLMWVPQSMWLLGWAVFALACVYLALHCVLLLVRGQHVLLEKTYGPQTLAEEIQSEAGEVLAAARLATDIEARAQAARPGARP